MGSMYEEIGLQKKGKKAMNQQGMEDDDDDDDDDWGLSKRSLHLD